MNYYLKPREVSDLAEGDPNKYRVIKIILKSRGRVKYKNYTPKRVRYLNPDIDCKHCGELININESNHELAHCSARCAGTPIPTRDYEYVLSRAKRIRRFALNDYPP